MCRLACPIERRENIIRCETHIITVFTAPKMVIGRDFNCVPTNRDCTGNMNFSTVLEKLITGFGLVDLWETVPPRAVYTLYTSNGATRLDCI